MFFTALEYLRALPVCQRYPLIVLGHQSTLTWELSPIHGKILGPRIVNVGIQHLLYGEQILNQAHCRFGFVLRKQGEPTAAFLRGHFRPESVGFMTLKPFQSSNPVLLCSLLYLHLRRAELEIFLPVCKQEYPERKELVFAVFTSESQQLLDLFFAILILHGFCRTADAHEAYTEPGNRLCFIQQCFKHECILRLCGETAFSHCIPFLNADRRRFILNFAGILRTVREDECLFARAHFNAVVNGKAI